MTKNISCSGSEIVWVAISTEIDSTTLFNKERKPVQSVEACLPYRQTLARLVAKLRRADSVLRLTINTDVPASRHRSEGTKPLLLGLDSLRQAVGKLLELIESRTELVDNLGDEHVGRRKVRRVFERLVPEPENVE
jgi:hypothetical protein